MAIKNADFWKRYGAILGVAIFGIVSFSAIANDIPESHKGMSHKGHAAPVPKGPPSIQKGSVPTTTFDANGRLWAVWAFGPHIYVNHSDDKGKVFSAAIKINEKPEKISINPEARPHIVVANNGNIYVSYAIKLKKRFSGHVKFSRSTNGGKNFSTPIIVNDNREMIGHSFPFLSINAKDQIFIAWLDSRDRVAAMKEDKEYNGSAIYYAVSNDDGASFQPNAKIVDTTCQCCRLGVVMDANDLPVVTWRHIYNENIRDQAMVRFTDIDSFTTPQRVSEDNWQVEACPHHGSTLAIDEKGSYHTAWFTNGTARQGLFYARSDNQGRQFTTPLPFGDLETQPKHPSLVSVTGSLYLAWKEFDGKQSRIHLMQSHDGGKQWQTAKVIATTNKNADHPFLISDGDTPYLSWHTKAEGYRLIPLLLEESISTATAPLDFVSGSMAQIIKQQDGAAIINFWSIDCPPCYKELKMWRELTKHYPALNVVLVSTDPAELRDEVMLTLIELGVAHLESWQFAESAEHLRFEIDRRWFGELPRTYFYGRNGSREAVSGLIKRDVVVQWIEKNRPPQKLLKASS